MSIIHLAEVEGLPHRLQNIEAALGRLNQRVLSIEFFEHAKGGTDLAKDEGMRAPESDAGKGSSVPPVLPDSTYIAKCDLCGKPVTRGQPAGAVSTFTLRHSSCELNRVAAAGEPKAAPEPTFTPEQREAVRNALDRIDPWKPISWLADADVDRVCAEIARVAHLFCRAEHVTLDGLPIIVDKDAPPGMATPIQSVPPAPAAPPTGGVTEAVEALIVWLVDRFKYLPTQTLGCREAFRSILAQHFPAAPPLVLRMPEREKLARDIQGAFFKTKGEWAVHAADAALSAFREANRDAGVGLGVTAEDVRAEVAWFAARMEEQLRANDHKPGWHGDDNLDLLRRLVQEEGELRSELFMQREVPLEASPERIVKEAADVANFAMMIADNAHRVGLPAAANGGDRG